MIDGLLAYLAPHHCYGCAKSGTLLCENCKYDIISEPFARCIKCDAPSGKTSNICTQCRLPFEKAWCVGDRIDLLEEIVNGFKFNNKKAACEPLADLLHQMLPELPDNTVIISIPTVPSHIRQRGYDHMGLIARQLSKKRKLPVRVVLERVSNATQHGATKSQRLRQAKQAFMCRQALDDSQFYLLIDDVITTGATVSYAAKTLQAAGAKHVWVAAICRQPSTRDRAPRAL